MQPRDIKRALHTYLLPGLLFLADFAALWVLTWIVGAMLHAAGGAVYIPRYWHLMLPALFCICMAQLHLYRTRRVFSECAGRMLRATFYGIVTAIVLEFILHTDLARVSRAYVLGYWLAGYAMLVLVRYLMRDLCTELGIWKNHIILVGAGQTAELFLRAFGENYQIDGFIEDDTTRPLLQKYAHLGRFEDMERVLATHPVHDVILAVPGLPKDELVKLFYRVQPYSDKVSVVPDIFGVPIGGIRMESSVDNQIVVLKTQNNLRSIWNRLLKRVFDLVCCFLGLVFVVPVCIAIAIAIKMDSPGPIIFPHQRIGQDGKKFPCYKFRSMIPNAQEVLKDYLAKHPEARKEWETDFKLKDDPRVTRVGAFLRRTSLDELPQIFDVIIGHMSLVGPRPIVDGEISKYGEYFADYCTVPPGITGRWQTSGRSDTTYDERVQMDSWYVRNWSLWQDIVILFRTIGVVFGRRGAY